MGMTIDDAIKILEHYNHGFCETSGGLSEPIKVAIETMHKYQKIEDIYYHQSGEALENSLRWVIEDGNVD